MIISEERFASGVVDSKGEAVLFDDPGEMIDWLQEEPLGDGKAWVHGYPSLEWMDAMKAIYVLTDEFPTPMGSGVVPFDNRTEAEAFANEKSGQVYTWEQLLQSWSFEAMG
jgi:copper chaperone NosL